MKSLFGHAERERKEGWRQKGIGKDRVEERGEKSKRRPQKKEERKGNCDRTRHFKNT